MKPDQSDTLAKAQAEAAHRPEPHAHINISALQCPVCNPGDPRAIGVPVDLRSFFGGDPAEEPDSRRCLFGHSVPANQGYSTKAGFVCTAHSSSFDND